MHADRLLHFFRAGMKETAMRRWTTGYSWVSSEKSLGSQPWMTRREAILFAKQVGKMARFHDTLEQAQQAIRNATTLVRDR